jgi:hypothetical protein
MKRLLLCAAATALLLTPLACDLGKLSNQVSAKKVMVGTLLSTPDVSFSPAAMAGLDAGTLPDGGTWGDAVTIPGQTAALVFFGTRENESGAAEPLTNATVRVEMGQGTPVTLENDGTGTYSRVNDNDEPGGVKYQNGATYRFVAAQEGQDHVGQVENAPQVERIDSLHPQEGYVRHTAGQPLTIQRPALQQGQERTLGFVTVLPLSADGTQGQPTYSTLPTSPLKFMEVVALPLEWKQDRHVIPGTAFPEARKTYLVVFQSVRTGGPESDNLFIGSAMLAGTADIGVVRTQ